MKLLSKAFLVILVELTLFVVDHQAPVLYVWHMPNPDVREVGKLETKRSEDSDDSTMFPWKRSAFRKPDFIFPRPSPPQQENKRDISLEDILIEEDKKQRSGGSDRARNIIHLKKEKHKVKKAEKPTWPAGTYGLPRPITGCPSSSGFKWETGFRFHDTEDDLTENQRSDSYHLAGKVSDDGIRQEFCMKTNPHGHGKWPDGKYCIYKKGTRCSDGMESGFVIWDDENKDNQNSAGGALPEGRYGEDTKIEYCCSTSGDWDQQIVLPTDRPFYLFSYISNKCQKVIGMKGVSEFIKYDDEDRGNIDYEGGEYPYGIHKGEKDHMIFLCYYTPIGKTFKDTVKAEVISTIKKTKYNKKQDAENKQKKIDKLEEMEKLRNSEKMMDAFLAVTAPHREETDKSERTKTIIKTIRVPERVKDRTMSIIATSMGIILGAILLGSVVLVMVLRHAKRRQEESNMADTLDEQALTFTNSSRRSSFATSDDELDIITEGDYEDELVEDQYLPSDSELKSGLELMFLKQQRHYWTKNRRPST